MPYVTKGKCVYKKDTGKKVGCTKGPVKNYLAALHANVNESTVGKYDFLKNNDLIGFTIKANDTVMTITKISHYTSKDRIITITSENPFYDSEDIGSEKMFNADILESDLINTLNSGKWVIDTNEDPFEKLNESENEFDWVPKEVNLNDHKVLYLIIEDTLKNSDFKIVKEGSVYHIEDEYGDIYFYISERDFNMPFIYHEIKDSIQFLKYENDNEMLPYYQKLMSLLSPLYKNNLDILFKRINESEDLDWVNGVLEDGVNIGDFYKINLEYPIVAKVEDIFFDDSKVINSDNSGYVVKVIYFNDNEEEEWGDQEEINLDWMYNLTNPDENGPSHWVKVTKEYAENMFKDYQYFKSPMGWVYDKNINESEEWYDDILNEKPLLRFDDLKVGDIISLLKTNTFSNLNSEFNNLIQDDIYYHIDSFKEATTHRNGYAEKETVAVCSLMKENPDTGNYYGISRETIDLVRGNNKPIWTLIYREGVMESINKSEDEFEWAEQLINEPIKDVIEGQHYRSNIHGKKIDIFIKKIDKGMVTFDALTYDMPNHTYEPILLRSEIDLDTPLWNAKRLVDDGYWIPIKKEDKMSNENINESEWFEDVVNEPIMLKVEELEMGDIVIPTCVKEGEYIVISKGTSVRLLDAPTHWATLKRNVKTNTGGVYFEHDTETGKNCRFKLIHRENDIIEESEEFNWVEDILSTSPLEFIGKEMMIDVSDLDDNEKIRLLDILEPHIDRDLDGSNSGGDWGWDCLIKNKKTKSLSLHCGIEDNEFEPQKGRVCCLSYKFGDEKEHNPESIVPIRGKDLLGLDIINQQTSMNESEEEEFNWAEDIIANTTEEIDISNDFDLWKNKLVEGSVVKITGRWEDMYFEDDVATIVNSPDTAGNHLLKFDRIIYEFGNEDEGYHTHCGENYPQNIKCECQRKRNNRDEVGKCWWTNLSFMEKIIYLPFEGKQITESEEDSELFWAEDLLKGAHESVNITYELDIMKELPVGSILQVKGYQDEMEFDMEEVKLIDKAEDKNFDSTYYLFKLKYEKRSDGEEMTHCGNGQKNMKICECRDTNEDDDYHQSEIGKCWWIELKQQDKVLYYPGRLDLSENKIKKPLLTEGRYDAITRKVVRDIMKVVNGTRIGDFILPWDVSNEQEYEQEGLSFNLELDIVETEDIEKFEVRTAIADEDDENIILMTIILGPKFNKQNLEALFYKLQEDVRHEIEHFTQMGPNRIEDRPIYKGSTANFKTVYGHHKNIIEIPALVRGFYRRAKIERKPIDEIMMDDLDTEIERGNLSKNTAQKLLTLWVDYAKKNLPHAIYRKD